MRFDLVDLRLFLAVAELGSITRAAERVHMALASASARIRGMEDDLGTALLERGARGVSLTPAGRTLARHAQTVQMQIETMIGDLNAYAKGLRGRVRLLSNTAATSEFLMPALARFLVSHPNIDVDLEERTSDMIIEAVRQGSADLGIVAPYVPLGDLESRPFALDRLVAICHADTKEPPGPSVALSALLHMEMIGLATGTPLQEHIIRNAARLGARIKFRVRVPRLDEVCELVARDVGIAIVPEAAALRSSQAKHIRILTLTDEWATRNLLICTRSFDRLPAHARLLSEVLKSVSDGML
jgi:DNA-binding transcriptional LysR family regulator